ncbi:MAG: cation:proton antiporter, partial [Streptococcaceae bacterium]|nr:cation:proton antiporter [Streptococcaceae bacterium]
MNDIFQITLILVASLGATLISRRIGIPAVVGQILVGILLSPSVFNLIHQGHTIEVLAEIGVILLMFLAGLESDLSLLKKYFRPSLLIAVTGVLIPLFTFGLILKFMGYDLSTSIFYGIVFAATSVSITIEVLQEYGKLKSKAGNIILGAAIVDDIIAVILLSVFTSTKTSSGNLTIQFLLEAVFLGFLVLLHFTLPRLWKFVERMPIFAKNTTVALVLCLILSLLANSVGLSAVIGSFFAGLAISQTDPAHKIEEYISVVAYTFFVPIFFVSIAISVTFQGLFSSPWLVLFLTVLAVLTKFIPAYLSGRIAHLEYSDSLLIGTGMIARGEMALIVAQIGLSSSIIDNQLYSELVIIIVLTTIISPFLIKWSLH